MQFKNFRSTLENRISQDNASLVDGASMQDIEVFVVLIL